MEIKKEVKDLCVEFIKEDINSERWKEIERILKNKYKFTSWNLLALFQNPSTIEYTSENMNLIMEKENG